MLKNYVLSLLIFSFALSSFHPVIATDYHLAPGDEVEIQILKKEELNTKQTIAPDGSLSLPLLGRVMAQNQTLTAFQELLVTEYGKYIKNPDIVLKLTPRSIYVVQHDVAKNTWDVKEAKNPDEARAYAGKDYLVSAVNTEKQATGNVQEKKIQYGDTVYVEKGKQADWFEGNWYKVVSAVAVVVGVVVAGR